MYECHFIVTFLKDDTKIDIMTENGKLLTFYDISVITSFFISTVQIAWNATLFYVCESTICEYNCLEYEYIASPDTSTKNARTSTLLRVQSSRESKNMHKYFHESRSMTRIFPRVSLPCTRAKFTRESVLCSRKLCIWNAFQSTCKNSCDVHTNTYLCMYMYF